MASVFEIINRTINNFFYAPVLLPLFVFGIIFPASCGKSSDNSAVIDGSLSSLRGGETRATLPPENFTGVTAQAYQAAKEIPEVLDSLYCYCDCEKHFWHKSLLTCYVDEHAENCDICINEALSAYELHRQGKDIKTIREIVDKRLGGIHDN